MADFLKYIPDSLKNLKQYQPGKTTAEIKRTLGLTKVVKLASNENPLGPSPKVKQAIIDHLNDITLYPEDAAPQLKQALADLNRVTPAQIILGAGSSEILEMVERLCLKPGVNLIIPEYAFGFYKITATALGADIKIIPEQNFTVDLEAMYAAIDSNTRLIMFANPNNPTGTWVDKDKLFAFIKKVPQDIVIVVDEAYTEYMDDPRYESALELLAEHDNLMIVRTFSKAYGMAGLRFGYCATSPQLADLMACLRNPFNVANLTLIAALAALDDTDYVAKTIATNKHGMQQLSRYFTELQLPILTQSCNFLVVKFGERALEICDALLKRGVIVRPLVPYNMPQHLRISIGTAEENTFFIEQLNAVLGR